MYHCITLAAKVIKCPFKSGAGFNPSFSNGWSHLRVRVRVWVWLRVRVRVRRASFTATLLKSNFLIPYPFENFVLFLLASAFQDSRFKIQVFLLASAFQDSRFKIQVFLLASAENAIQIGCEKKSYKVRRRGPRDSLWCLFGGREKVMGGRR